MQTLKVCKLNLKRKKWDMDDCNKFIKERHRGNKSPEYKAVLSDLGNTNESVNEKFRF